jgi:hypothetical protein
LAQLLAVASRSGSKDEQLPEAPSWRQYLEDRLASPLALDPEEVDSVTAVLGRPCRELLPLAEKSLGDLITDTDTSLEVLATLREYGKALSLRWEDGLEHAVATTLYYAAIAAALIYHRQKMASRSFGDLARTMDLLASTPWMTPPMAELFSEARRLCQEA